MKISNLLCQVTWLGPISCLICILLDLYIALASPGSGELANACVWRLFQPMACEQTSSCVTSDHVADPR